MSTLTIHCPKEDISTREVIGLPTSDAESKKNEVANMFVAFYFLIELSFYEALTVIYSLLNLLKRVCKYACSMISIANYFSL